MRPCKVHRLKYELAIYPGNERLSVKTNHSSLNLRHLKDCPQRNVVSMHNSASDTGSFLHSDIVLTAIMTKVQAHLGPPRIDVASLVGMRLMLSRWNSSSHWRHWCPLEVPAGGSPKGERWAHRSSLGEYPLRTAHFYPLSYIRLVHSSRKSSSSLAHSAWGNVKPPTCFINPRLTLVSKKPPATVHLCSASWFSRAPERLILIMNGDSYSSRGKSQPPALVF